VHHMYVSFAYPVLALRQAATKLPTKMEFINRSAPPRLGNMLITPDKPVEPPSVATAEAVVEAATA
jgi:hypothetical protein